MIFNKRATYTLKFSFVYYCLSLKFILLGCTTLREIQTLENSSDTTPNILQQIPTECHALPFPRICGFCGAKKFKNESKDFCWSDGTIRFLNY